MPRVELNGVSISYRDSGGEGTPVVLVHGFPFDSELWDPQFEALGESYRLIAPDVRGFGESDATTEYSMDAFADDLAALLDHLQVERAVVGGLSMGGYITFAFLRRHRERIAALVLADTRPDADSAEVRARREGSQVQVRTSGGASLIDGFVVSILSEETQRERPDAVEALKRVMDQNDDAWIGGLEAMKNRTDSSDLLSTIDVPTLIVVGEHDPLAPVDVARDMHDRIRHSRLVVVEGAGHVASLEVPGAFNAALDAFLQEL